MHPSMSIDPRLFAPAAARNREPILAALRVHLPPSGTVLEVASGSGEHIVYLAEALPNLVWQPTDLAAERRASIDAWVHSAGLANVLPALPLDAAAAEWAVTSADVVLCINMIHIAPAAATAGLLIGAASVLPPDGLLALYGPFRRAGQPLEPSNAAFDADLRSRNPDWGLRVLEEVVDLAERAGFAAPRVEAMPANNLMVFFRQASR
jgi:cyclopropane fatty-acyl-phospholipid synthase-like methyltransferase